MIVFAVAALTAALGLFFSWVVYRAGRGNFLNRAFSASLFFLSCWVICAFINLLPADPSPSLVTWQYRTCYTLITLAAGSFFLFGLGFLKGGSPGKKWLLGVIFLLLVCALLNLLGLTLRQATYSQGIYRQDNGPLYPLFIAWETAFAGGALLLVWLKRRKSRGIERTRATYILAAFGLFAPLAIVLAAVIPAVMERDVTSDYAVFLTAFPVSLTGYAILRHRLLDVRLAVRRSFSYLLTAILFGAPLIAAFFLSSYIWKDNPRAYLWVSACWLALAVAFTPAALRRTSRLASRLFFSGLYDEVELLHRFSSAATSRSDIREGIAEGLVTVCDTLGLTGLLVAVPEEASGTRALVLGARRENGMVRPVRYVDDRPSPLYGPLARAILLEETRNEPDGKEEGAFLEEMRKEGLVAAVPVGGYRDPLGTLLAGEKANRTGLDPMDLEFLFQLAERLSLYIENYRLSMRLLNRVEELGEARKKLEESDRFKTDIINITAHEFRTPLTLLTGFSTALAARFQELTYGEKMECLENIVWAGRRLNALLDKFVAAAALKSGKAEIRLETCDLREILEETVDSLEEGDRERVRLEAAEAGLAVTTDRRHLVLALRNLVENGLRYSEEGSPVSLGAGRNSGGATVWVRDRGEGIPPDLVDYLFHPFARLEEVDKHRRGAGLGLHIVRLVAEALDMDIEVESKPGEGSTFRLLIKEPAAGGKGGPGGA